MIWPLCLQNGLNALHLAAKEGHVGLVQELLERGSAVDSATKVIYMSAHLFSKRTNQIYGRGLEKEVVKLERSKYFTCMYSVAFILYTVSLCSWLRLVSSKSRQK